MSQARTFSFSLILAISIGWIACGDTDDDAPLETVRVLIPAATGGTVSLPSGAAKLVIQPMALAEDTEITLKELPGSSETLINIYEFGPSGLTFQKPAELSLLVDPSLMVGRKVFLAREENGKFVALDWSTVSEDYALGDVEHFSRYSVIPKPDNEGAGG